MDVTEYYELATSFLEMLRVYNEKDFADELDKILENEDEDSPRIWVQKTHALLLNIYKQKMNVPFAIEFLNILVAGENSKKYWTNKFINCNINRFDIKWDPYGFVSNDKWFRGVEKNEDILQLVHVYSDGPTIDLGWYGNIYKIYVIKNSDWDNPVEVIENRTAKDAANNIYKLIDKYANGFVNNNENK